MKRRRQLPPVPVLILAWLLGWMVNMGTSFSIRIDQLSPTNPYTMAEARKHPG